MELLPRVSLRASCRRLKSPGGAAVAERATTTKSKKHTTTTTMKNIMCSFTEIQNKPSSCFNCGSSLWSDYVWRKEFSVTFSFHELAEVSNEEQKARSELQSAQSGSCCHIQHVSHDHVYFHYQAQKREQASCGTKVPCTIFPYGILFQCISCTSVYPRVMLMSKHNTPFGQRTILSIKFQLIFQLNYTA